MIHDRRAGRAIVLDPDGHVLMIRGHDPDDLGRGGFLWTPGGGIDAGETVEAGTRRELWEETGLRVDELGPVVLTRVGEFAFGGRLIRQHERYYCVEVGARFEPIPHFRSELEHRAIDEIGWYSIPDLERAPEPYYPYCLVELVAHIAEHGRPDDPWAEEQRLNG